MPWREVQLLRKNFVCASGAKMLTERIGLWLFKTILVRGDTFDTGGGNAVLYRLSALEKAGSCSACPSPSVSCSRRPAPG